MTVGGKSFNLSPQEYAVFEEGKQYTVYYTPRRKLITTWEPFVPSEPHA